ncbi:MAG: agmatinase, partial [Cyanobacteria bacterium]|nr:agmatinase [Cyanobacteriota bacterium]
KGACEAPSAIRAAMYSESSNLWTETGIDLESRIDDAGDVVIDSRVGFAGTLEDTVRSLLQQKRTPICLGGDHSITYPIVSAMSSFHPNMSILHFDAHPDLYDDFQSNPFSHASPFARIMERRLVKRCVQVGIRTMNGHQREQVAKFGVEVHEMKDWRDDLVLQFDGPLYISFDLDALDPAFAPGVSRREPGGLSTRQAIRIIHQLDSQIVGADIVELNPRQDPTGVSSSAAAKIIKEIAGVMLRSR